MLAKGTVNELLLVIGHMEENNYEGWIPSKIFDQIIGTREFDQSLLDDTMNEIEVELPWLATYSKLSA